MPLNIDFELRWKVTRDGAAHTLEPLVLELLRGVRAGGHLNYAAKNAGVSYRHAWGLMRDWEARLGHALLCSRQGRGAHLTAYAEALLEISAATASALAPALSKAALEAAAKLSDAGDTRRHALTMVSSHSERVLALRDHLKTRYRVALDISGSENALHRYRRGDAELAGFHLPLGELGRSVAAALIGLLDPKRDQLWLLEQRTLGLLSRAEQGPLNSLEQLGHSDLRFVNRQPGSGTRLIFDGLLGQAGIAPGSIRGYDSEEYSHTAVAALVASNNADAAFATADAARQMALQFHGLVEERFYILMSGDSDSSLRRTVSEFCGAHARTQAMDLKDDEFAPTVAVLKRVHRAGFWKNMSQAT